MRVLKDTLNYFLAAFGVQLEPWMAPAAAVVVALLLLPAWHRNFRTKQARKRILALANSPSGQHAALQQQILGLVRGNSFGQVVVVEESLRRGLGALARSALADLEASGKKSDHARRLRRQLNDERATTPEAEALAVERLRAGGLEAAATDRLHLARKRWPDHPALR